MAQMTEELRSIRLQLPESVQLRFRVAAARHNKSMAAIARMLVEEWLKKEEGGRK
jgi:plasmid stability protein